MTSVIVAAEAERDLDDILSYLQNNAGPTTAAAYADRFALALSRLIQNPGIGSPRESLGAKARVVIVYPYVLIYDFSLGDESAIVLRVLHGKRDLNAQIISRGKPV